MRGTSTGARDTTAAFYGTAAEMTLSEKETNHHTNRFNENLKQVPTPTTKPFSPKQVGVGNLKQVQ
jgi:hypothetical protein